MIGGEGGDFNEVVGNIFPIKFVSHEIGKKTFATFEKIGFHADPEQASKEGATGANVINKLKHYQAGALV